MNEDRLMDLIERDRRAPLPEGPDPHWIAARVWVAAGRPAAPTESAAEIHLLLVLAILGVLVPIGAALYAGHAEWLLIWPVLLLLLTPLLLRKGAAQR